MATTRWTVDAFETDLPETLERFTDIYFTWSRQAAEQAEYNPTVSKIIHAGAEADAAIAGLEETAQVYDAMTDDQVDIYLTDAETFDGRTPLMVVEGPAQQLFEPETVALGTLSYHLTDANQGLGYDHPSPDAYGDGVSQVTERLADLSETIGEDIGFADFGARHDHPARQPALARAAYRNGAIGHSTQAGVDAINAMAPDADLDPSGTMPHAYVLTAAAEHGMDDATLEAFKTYDALFDGPTPVLVDTNNAERDDTLQICEYLEATEGADFELVVRMDTNSANYAQTVPPDERTPENTGMSIPAIRGMSETLREHGYRENVTFLISSGMGKTTKLDPLIAEAKDYYEETGVPMFDGVGAGSFDTTNRLYTTSDIVRADGDWLGKAGRLTELQDAVDHDLDSYVDTEMRQYTG